MDQIIKKKVLCSINFRNVRSFDDLNKDYSKFIEVFNFIINCQSEEDYKNFIEIKDLKNLEIERFVNEIYLNERN